MRCAVAGLILALAAAAGGLAFVHAGLADVAASSPDWALTRWVLSTAMRNAVERRAAGVGPPARLDDEARVRAGAVAYDALCATCHGAPGVERGVIGTGLNPEPPALAETASEWSAAALFWITRHGIRMTGMPAFGSTHSDDELWDLVALVQRLPDLSPAEYRALVGSAGGGDHGHSHDHDG